jgi:hypothetical protein
VLGAHDGGDDVAAERRADLKEEVGVGLALGREVADAQVGTVGGEAGAQGARYARRQVAAGGRGAVEDDLRLVRADEAGDEARVRQRQVVAEVVVVGEVHGVGAAGDEGGREGPDGLTRPCEHGADADAEPVGELAGTAEQLEADLGRRC